jgi:hypothetical protein
MLELPTLAKTAAALNAAPVAVLALVGLWLTRKLVKLAVLVLVLVLAAVVGAVLWVRGGL